MKDGMISPSVAAPFGYTPDLFEGWLWKMGDAIIISFIECLVPGKGHFRKLVENILSSGFSVRIPTPLGKMERIVRKNGYVQTFEYDKDFGEEVEIWTKRPPADNAEAAVNSTQLKSKNNGVHLIVKDRWDYWPSTGLFIDRQTKKKGRGIKNLLWHTNNEK